ncbi:protein OVEREXPRESSOR OF CATIONIC PEROXIDASE 3-like [Papaver somniferum]|uniref:protein OVEREXPRESSOR OF CATIONIC PEROXIDASE 3-like n=1 Tax=Papaver somniferum TaxID=3469 RepID=UPI000E6FC19B|nr:protein OVEREXPRESSOR OF CATIONIC PEROXIDASE 3-like [Papaver somniferum]
MEEAKVMDDNIEGREDDVNHGAPVVGMTFGDREELFNFYKDYNKRLGFGVKKRSNRKDDNGVLRRTTFTCTKGNFYEAKNHPYLCDSPHLMDQKQSLTKKSEVEVVDDINEDAIEALFNQLEEDLKSDASFADGDDDLTEEDLARLEKELKEAFGEDADLFEMLQLSEENIQNSDDAEDGEEDEEDEEEEEIDDDDEEEEESPVQLKNWQLRRLATALKIGRRKISIQTLAAELCLDRDVVLELLREPPPNLFMLSAALPDIVGPKPIEIEGKPIEVSTETIVDVPEPSVEASDGVLEPDPKVKVPVHAMESRWSAQKRLKKVQTETLERVYLRSKRPTNALISSIVHVTNLPKKRVVKWFEDKRAEDGIAEDRLPYQRSKSETVSTS